MVQDLEPFYWERKERTGLKKYFTIPKIGIYFDGVEVAEVTSPTLAEAITEAMNHGFYLGAKAQEAACQVGTKRFQGGE